MGITSASTRGIRKYYQRHFGPLNTSVTLRNHLFFMLDAPGLVDEDYQRSALGVSFDRWEPIPGGAVEAVRNVATRKWYGYIRLRGSREADHLLWLSKKTTTRLYYCPIYHCIGLTVPIVDIFANLGQSIGVPGTDIKTHLVNRRPPSWWKF